MAETDGSIAIGISFKLDELKKSSDAALAEIQKLTVKFKEQGENSGNVYVKGFGKSTRQLNNMLNDFVKNMGNISPQMGQLGEKIASQFSKPIFAILPKLAMAFKTALPIIALIAGAIALVTKAVGGAVKAQKEFSDNVKLSYKAQAALADTLGKA
ncbi:MAG: hypothetical protein LBC27_09715, partial [Spirochaetaceae bacterium]|nr:hypothetical protein [Spirochaetaceae bacterium]